MRHSANTIRLALLASLVLHGPAQADLIAEYNFNDENDAVDFAAAGVTASDFLDGQGIGVKFDVGFADARRFASSTSAAEALDEEDYLEFTLTADPNTVMDLSTVTFDHARELLGPLNYQLEVNGSLIGSAGFIPLLGDSVSIDLSSFTNQSSLTFRLLGWNALSNNAIAGWLIDNLRVNGMVRVMPEPGTFALVALGAPALWWFRRRSQRGCSEDEQIAPRDAGGDLLAAG